MIELSCKKSCKEAQIFGPHIALVTTPHCGLALEVECDDIQLDHQIFRLKGTITHNVKPLGESTNEGRGKLEEIP